MAVLTCFLVLLLDDNIFLGTLLARIRRFNFGYRPLTNQTVSSLGG